MKFDFPTIFTLKFFTVDIGKGQLIVLNFSAIVIVTVLLKSRTFSSGLNVIMIFPKPDSTYVDCFAKSARSPKSIVIVKSFDSLS
jgi:hypothetical protein